MTTQPVNTPELREQCAQALLAAARRAPQIHAFAGVDGFVDEIIHVVDKRQNADAFQRLPTIARLAERLAAAAGKSTNIELVNHQTKLGGNGPIMANALAHFGLPTVYLGALGYPNMHPVFNGFASHAQVHSIAEPGHTDALEFDDGKLLLGKLTSLNDLTWENVQQRFGRERFIKELSAANLVAFVNWTMIPHMSELWEAILKEVCPTLTGPRRRIFFDLADPEKRTQADIRHALDLIVAFGKYFDVILGLNEKEAHAVGAVLDLPHPPRTPEGLAALARDLHQHLPIETLVIHPLKYAAAVTCGKVDMVAGPFVEKPAISTGGGDHFNAGFCLGKVLGLDNVQSLLTGVATSGFYVRSAKSPTIPDLAGMLRAWPTS